MAEAGWYHVEGDPPGTVRRWNGVEWIGFPIPDPNTASGTAGQHHRPARLTQRGSIWSVLAIASLSALAVAFVFVASRIWSDIDNLDPLAASDEEVGLRDFDRYVDNLGNYLLVLIVGMAVCGVIFVIWLRAAATAAEVHRFNRPRGSALSRRRSTAETIVLLWLFGIFAVIFWVLATVLEDVSSNGRGNMFAVVSDTAMASSIDPRTGIAAIGPIKIMIWWALWWGSILAGIIAWVAMAVLTPVAAATLQGVLQLTVVLLALEVVSLVLIIITIGQITARLTR